MSRFAAATGLALAAAAAAAGVGGAARGALLAGVAGAYVLLIAGGAAFVRWRFFLDAFCRGAPGRRRLALTFDDGPDPQATPALLDALRELQAPAAFFCIGERAAAHPELLKRIAAERHEIGNHSFRHGWWTNLLLGGGLRREIERAQETLGAITGVRPRYFRSPMGLTNPHLPGALRAAGVRFIGWDVGGGDRGAPPEALARRLLARLRDGSVILLHDGRADPAALVAAVRQLVVTARQQGYAFVPLEELVR